MHAIARQVVIHGHVSCMQAPAQLSQPAGAASSLGGAMSGLELDDADSLQLQQALELSMSGAGLEQAVDQALQVAGLLSGGCLAVRPCRWLSCCR